MTQNINLIRSAALIKSLSDEDILTNLNSGTFKVTSYKKSSVVHFDVYDNLKIPQNIIENSSRGNI